MPRAADAIHTEKRDGMEAVYEVLSPIPNGAAGRIEPAGPIADLSGKTICAMRHTFRADETFPMIEALLKEKYKDINFISNFDMPDARPATAEEEAELIALLKEKGADAVLAGNGA